MSHNGRRWFHGHHHIKSKVILLALLAVELDDNVLLLTFSTVEIISYKPPFMSRTLKWSFMYKIRAPTNILLVKLWTMMGALENMEFTCLPIYRWWGGLCIPRWWGCCFPHLTNTLLLGSEYLKVFVYVAIYHINLYP